MCLLALAWLGACQSNPTANAAPHADQTQVLGLLEILSQAAFLHRTGSCCLIEDKPRLTPLQADFEVHIRRFYALYLQMLTLDPRVQGTLVVLPALNQNGEVIDIAFERSSLPHDFSWEILELIKTVRFHPAEGPIRVFAYPLHFYPTDA